MNPDYIMRPARLSDFDALKTLAEESGPGFTSLPVDKQILEQRLDKSVKSFGGELDQLEYGKYLLIMEHVETGEVAGCSAVKAGVGMSHPFYNYRIITVAQASLAADRRFDMDALVLTNEFVGYTEVGTLFIREKHRGGGVGRLAAQSRYLLMNTQPDRFGDMVLAELRGVVSKEGQTPFWDCLGRQFFRMDFTEADYLSATTNNQFILDLMPKYPIYIDLLPPEAREVIGRVHSDGVGALKLLEWEGFRFERVVDIFDGGPMVVAPVDRVRTGREAKVLTLVEGAGRQDLGIAARLDLENFRATGVIGNLREDENEFQTDLSTIERLGLEPGDKARIWIRSDK